MTNYKILFNNTLILKLFITYLQSIKIQLKIKENHQ